MTCLVAYIELNVKWKSRSDTQQVTVNETA